jgi:hypothetical protein
MYDKYSRQMMDECNVHYTLYSVHYEAVILTYISNSEHLHLLVLRLGPKG